tara:strand:- start:2355 stop:2552 length:198 start_codon:yes stop_codon:yes gene_type:complete
MTRQNYIQLMNRFNYLVDRTFDIADQIVDGVMTSETADKLIQPIQRGIDEVTTRLIRYFPRGQTR